MTLKQQLEERAISISRIGRDLQIDKSVISRILNNIYEGSDDTKKKVLAHIEFILRDKVDLNPIVYEHIGLFIKLIDLGMINKKFTVDERLLLTQLYKDLDKYKNSLNPNDE